MSEVSSSSPPRAEIAGSSRTIDPGWQYVGLADPTSTATVSVYVRDPAAAAAEPSGGSVGGAVSREEYQAAHRARDSDIQAVLDFAAEQGLAVGEISPERRIVQLAGTLDALTQAFGVQVGLYQQPDLGVFRGRSGPITVPAALGPVISGVFGLDNRVAARTQFRPSAAPEVQYTPPQVAQAYNFPPSANGAGQTVAILEFGGARPRDRLCGPVGGRPVVPGRGGGVGDGVRSRRRDGGRRRRGGGGGGLVGGGAGGGAGGRAGF